MTDRTFLVHEAEPALAPFLADHLAGWRVVSASSAWDFAGEFAGTLPVHAALLAGEGDHAALAEALRRARMIGPIFSLGDAAMPPLIVLPRPFRLASLLTRLEDPNGAAIDGVALGAWRIDAAQRALTPRGKGEAERLTDKEFEVLALLLAAAPETVSRERLQSEIWRYHADTDSHTVETHIWRLRQKLEADPGQPRILVTDADGYRVAYEE